MSQSEKEEILAALYFIAGALFWSSELKFFAWFCIAKGVLDSLCAIFEAVREIKAKRAREGGK